ncbi:MAG: glycoside hydrolase family 31 protein [Prevotellaceae bacterium]|nr:glycoside hydrolase family 31 protein [Prevotellaceae bacterium]
MSKRLRALTLLCLAFLAAQAEEALKCDIVFYSPSIVRVVKYPATKGIAPEKQSLCVVMEPEQTEVTRKEDGSVVTMKSSTLQVTYDEAAGTVSFADVKGNPLLREDKAEMTIRTEGADQGSFRCLQSFVLDSDEAVYGLGQSQNGKLVQRSLTRYMTQENLEDVVPLLHSVKGYAIFWDNCSPTTFSDTQDATSFDSEVGDCIDYYFLYGGTADGVIAQMRQLTGQAPMFPLWTYGFWQSRERYESQKDLVDVVRRYRQSGVPLDGIIQDWQYWGNNYLWNAMDFLNPQFPDPKRMIDDVHAMNAHIIISVWASFGPQTLQFRELQPKGMLLDFHTWPSSGLEAWPPNMNYPSGVKPYDPYNPEARDIYWRYMNEGLFSRGIDGWWLDSTEPDHEDFTDQSLETPTHLGSFRKVRNAFPLMTVGGVYDHQRATTSDKRVFILTRSAFAGQQRYGANTWSGDVTSSWETLRKQIPAGINFSLTGIPNWNTDIGGFFCGAYNNSGSGSAPHNPAYQELYVRWLQFGAFCPMMRSHGTEAPREIYQFGQRGEPVFDAIERAIRLRYSLLPYIYSTSWQVTHNQYTFLRALMMDFPSDKRVWDMADEYMFGNALLVAPVLDAQYTTDSTMPVDFTASKSKSLYLPAGTTWYDFWTGESQQGGKQLDRATPLDLIPLYVRAGSILPLGPDVQYATEKPWDHLELRVYPGADGSFTLYEDEFDNYNYEQGAYTEIPLTWKDSARTLTIGARQGNYPGMLTARSFTVTLPDGTSKEVPYSGKKLTVKF